MFKISGRGRFYSENGLPYLDKNARNKAAALAPKAPVKPLFPFNELQPGDWFEIEFPTGKEQSMRTMLHQHARLEGVWIKTFVKTANKKTTVFHITHDGKRL
jgi:hypothetical protein